MNRPAANIGWFVICLISSFSCKKTAETSDLLTILPVSVTGIEFENRLTETEEMNIIEYLYFNNGAGVAVGDINNDGLIDLYFTGNQIRNGLYLNKGNLKFEDITEAAGVGGSGSWKTGVTMADVNNDGWLDIYVCQVGDYKSLRGKNQLFINNGDLTFSEKAAEYGLDFRGFATQAAFFDYDADGDLDVYLVTHSIHSSRNYGRMELRFEVDTLSGDKLYRNDLVNGKRYFKDITNDAGILSSQIGYGLAVGISDINNDGLPDIYVSNDFHEDDYLYINNGNGTFTEKLREYIAHTSRSSMGNDIADFNNDGYTDILVLDMLPEDPQIRRRSGGEDDYDLTQIKLNYGYHHQFVRNTLQLNLGNGYFSEIGQLAGIYSTDWSWSPLFCDLDNDGWKDIFITSGIYRRGNDLDYVDFLTGGNSYSPGKDNSSKSDKELYEKMPLFPNQNYYFHNNGDLTFRKISGKWSETRSYSNGSAFADLDNDGDLDLIVNRINEPAAIYRNNGRTENHYLQVALDGGPLNPKGTGTRVSIYSNGQQQVAEQFTTRGFMSSSMDRIHFGLGKNTVIDSLIVSWPDHSVQKMIHVQADTILILDIRNASESLEKEQVQQVLFSETNIPGFEFTHKEDRWVDFLREPLIPFSLSAEGPSLAMVDINGDGLDDVFVGGAKGERSKLMIGSRQGKFTEISSKITQRTNISDNVDALFFDADGDGDPDLYLVKGGNEYPVGHPLLSDNLLINDGKGNFEYKKGFYVSHNGSCVRPADFDDDGDIDLFVGSRSVPGNYGLPPEQYLLQNDGMGNFKDVTSEYSPELKNAGMVTDAAWADMDGDDDKDLIVVGEWMKVSWFINSGGRFVQAGTEAGLDSTSGWWSSVECTDFDGDGDEDIIAGNLGLNSMLKASENTPLQLYLNDFDNSGSTDPVLGEFIKNKILPIASLDELNAQIKGIRNQFTSYADFSLKTLEDIFKKEALDGAKKLEAQIFESCIFMNNGKGNFSRLTLPNEVQFSTVRDILAEDFNRDGIKDLLVIGNNYQSRPSLGRFDASYGWYLQGSPDGFIIQYPTQSGFFIQGDARHLIPITIHGQSYLLIALNNSPLRVIKIKE